MGSISVLMLFSYPSPVWQILDAHNDEVWFVQFSHDGKYLATASKDQTAIIWEVISDDEIYASVLF